MKTPSRLRRWLTKKSSKNASPIVQTSSFFRLPAEIRVRIYEYVLRGSEKIRFMIGKRHGRKLKDVIVLFNPGPPGLLSTCCQISAEAIPVLFDVRKLQLYCHQPSHGNNSFQRHAIIFKLTNVIREIQDFKLISSVRDGDREEATLCLLDWICDILEKREKPPRRFSLQITCYCFDFRPGMPDNSERLANLLERLTRFGPIRARHLIGLNQTFQCVYSNILAYFLAPYN